MSKLKEVCEELDKVLIEVMTTLDELSSLRAKYSEAVSEGYFYMAQARHAMGGPSSVSALQYDARMSALVHVESVPQVKTYDELVSSISSKEELSTEFKIDRINPSKPVKKPTTETKSTGEGELRRRNVEHKDTVEDVPQQKTKETVTIESKDAVIDPIKWFGVLVPPYLRRSQDHFKQVIVLVAELAGTQLKLETLRREFRELLKKKMKLGTETTEQCSIEPSS